jgi:S1-C subfamily serine protease
MSVRMPVRAVTFLSVVLCCATGMAQVPAQPPRKAPAPRRPVVMVKKPSAPQVVTIVHRLNGLKMFRLLSRSQQQVQAIAGLNSAFSLMDDVHTNVIAGLAMDDGETIAAWLPDAEVEFGPQIPGNLFGTPDVTVMGSDGKRLPAKYVGLDAVTGLSILRLADKKLTSPGVINDGLVDVGENVRLFGPEPVTGQTALVNATLYVRIAAREGRINDVTRAPSGGIARFKVSSARLSAAIIGGIAVNEAGETVGIVDGLEGSEASVLPTALIRRAARRVLERQASVPRPWLGVKGEPVADLKLDQILNHGWQPARAAALAGEHRGILLTSIVPGSPAAQAALRAGDVILKVNDKAIDNAEDFTWFLEEAGPSSSVSFTVARPDRVKDEALSVKLSGMLDPAFSFKLRNRLAGAKGFSLIEQGIETIALKAPVASQLGTTAGLLVVYVEPSSAAFEAGLQPGDVIQSINGKAVSSFTRPFLSPSSFTFEIVRNKEKLVVTVTNPAKKK